MRVLSAALELLAILFLAAGAVLTYLARWCDE